MFPRGITREAIEALNEIEPHCFETDREEQWFNVGLQYGLDVADANPKSPWISVEDDLPYNHEDMIALVGNLNKHTCSVLVRFDHGGINFAYMYCSGCKQNWYWAESSIITHWIPIPKLKKD